MILSEEQKDSLQKIQGSQAFKVMEYILQLKIEELDTVTTLDARSIDKVGVEALARQKAVKLLTDFLNDLGFVAVKKTINRTYE